MYRHHPPPVRAEFLIGATRVLLAFAALMDVWLDARSLPVSPLTFQALFYYLAYSIAMFALIWKPVSITSGWIIAVHTFDVVAVALFVSSAAPDAPVLLYFVFILICAILRWGSSGAFWTACGSVALFAAAWAYGAVISGPVTFDLDQLVRRSVHFCGAAALIGYLGTYSHPLKGEISRVALWPRRVPRTSRALVSDIIAQSREALESPAVLLVWTAPDDARLNLAWHSDEGVVWTREPTGTYGTLVASELEQHSFQSFDATRDTGRVVHWAAGRLRQRRCRSVNESLRARFNMRALQSCRLEGEFIKGRLFSFGKDRMHVDDLIVGDLVARLAAGQLDRLYLVTQMGESAALEERLRVARDLHDNLAQTLAGTALQLRAARRLLEFNPTKASRQLEEVQYQLKRDQLEVRSMIRRLRPASMPAPQYPAQDDAPSALGDRLRDLQSRIQKQWGIPLQVESDVAASGWPEAAVEQLFRLIQEAALNAARHAEASIIRVRLNGEAEGLRLVIEDDGKGFPFHGTFDLASLAAMGKGPLTLRERVAELGGSLHLDTDASGSRVTITLNHSLAAS